MLPKGARLIEGIVTRIGPYGVRIDSKGGFYWVAACFPVGTEGSFTLDCSDFFRTKLLKFKPKKKDNRHVTKRR